MALSSEVLSQFAKATTANDKDKKETSTVYGTVVEAGSTTKVKFDGSNTATPVATTVNVKEGDRVVVMIKNHSATITGNLKEPSINLRNLDENNEDVERRITELGYAVADKVSTSQLNAMKATITKELTAKDVLVQETLTASIVEVEGRLTAKDAEITRSLTAAEAQITELNTNKLSVESASATYATITNLSATNTEINNLKTTHANFENATSNNFTAVNASITGLNTVYANIDFSNIGNAAMEYLFATSGLIENVVVSEGSVTGVLAGVTIRGDIIEGNTIVADKLVIQGDDGLYYKLNTNGVTTGSEQTDYNSLNGSIIAAKTITASKINVDDLAAFGATIGGFSITMDALYSGVKESVDNSTKGVYMDSEGQLSIGDADNFIRYFRDDTGKWKLEIAAESILFGGESKSSADDIRALTEHVKIGTYTDQKSGDVKPCVELSEGDSDFKQVITNTSTMFMDGGMVRTKVDTDGVTSENVTVDDELRQGGFIWKVRSNGNLGLIWKGGSN